MRLLKERKSEVPFILVTGSHSEEVAVECMKEGADDYILKASLRRLPSALRNTISKKEAEREKLAVEAAFSRSKERYRLITENTRDLICLLDLQFKFIYASPSHLRVLGYPAADLIGRNCLDFIHPEDAQLFEETLDEALFFREGRNAELRFRHGTGHWLLFESTGSFIFDLKSMAQHALVVSRDTSDRKRAEKEIRKLAAFPRFNPNPPRYGFGDGEVLRQLRRLAWCAVPMITMSELGAGDREPKASFAVTPAGRNVLEGTVDFIDLNTPDYWLGGAHLRRERVWRWDAERGLLV